MRPGASASGVPPIFSGKTSLKDMTVLFVRVYEEVGLILIENRYRVKNFGLFFEVKEGQVRSSAKFAARTFGS